MCKNNLNLGGQRRQSQVFMVSSGSTGGNRHKLKHRRFALSVRKQFSIVRVTKHWFPREVVESPSEEIF